MGRKEENITITVVDSRVLSTKWYLYAYIDNPLTSSDNKYILNDSLILVTDTGELKTLSENPTLLYSGTENGGNTKTTKIEWTKNTGILFQVINPLHNNEIYTTSIKWILTSEEL